MIWLDMSIKSEMLDQTQPKTLINLYSKKVYSKVGSQESLALGGPKTVKLKCLLDKSGVALAERSWHQAENLSVGV